VSNICGHKSHSLLEKYHSKMLKIKINMEKWHLEQIKMCDYSRVNYDINAINRD